MKSSTKKTHAALGYRMPAEWEPHEATWLGWPRNTSDWPGKFAPIPWAYAEIARALAPGEMVRIVVESPAHELRARQVLSRAGVDLARIRFFRWPSDRGWMRDSFPAFVTRKRAPRVALASFGFNAWAKYSDWKRDAQMGRRAARALRLPLLEAAQDGRRVVLEGGAIDVNGRGTILATEECLLDPKTQVRNPGYGAAEYERVFRDWLGAPNTIWLGRGIAGDDTHGHVDDIARFANARTIVACEEKNRRDANYGPLKENLERLKDARLEDGSKPKVVALPMPAPLYFEGRRLPASYANFYIANAAVLVPTFNDPRDREALGILGDLFKDRPVRGIHAVDLVWGLGTLHCLTHEQPAAPQSKRK